MNKVLIASLDNWDSCAEIPYIFKKAGCIVDVYCTKNGWLQTNGYHDKWIEAPKNIDSYLQIFFDLVDINNYTLIILTDEPLLKILNERIENKELFIKVMPLIKVENRKMLSSKIGFSDFCISNDVLTPRYAIYQSETDIETIVQNLNFPLINKNEFSWGGTDMCIINSKLELIELLKSVELKQPILFQEFIEGEEIRIDAYYYRGELIVYFCAKVLNYANNRFTYNTRRVYYTNSEIKSHLIDLGKKSGANGFANINYIHEIKSNKYFLIEMDLRTNSWLAYSQYLSKNNFISGIKKIINKNQHTDPEAVLFKDNIEIALFYKDFKRIYWQRDLRGLFRWIFNLKGFWRFLPFYDLKLSKKLIKDLFYEFVTHRIQTVFKKKI
jgi:predicted ATP-grasp superfamily ATP-dependent carboligase